MSNLKQLHKQFSVDAAKQYLKDNLKVAPDWFYVHSGYVEAKYDALNTVDFGVFLRKDERSVLQGVYIDMGTNVPTKEKKFIQRIISDFKKNSSVDFYDSNMEVITTSEVTEMLRVSKKVDASDFFDF